MKEFDKLISDVKTIQGRGLILTMDGFITMLENFNHENNIELKDILLDFLLHLNDKQLINNYDFDYEEETNKFLEL